MDPNLRRVLSQAVRVEILERIAKRPTNARQLAESSGDPLSKITYHTSVLYDAGCIVPCDPDQSDPGERIYEIAALDSAPPRLPLSDTNRGRALSSVLRRIVETGRAALQAGTLGDDSRLSCSSILLDEEGLRDTHAILDEAAERIEATRDASARRLAQDGANGLKATVALAAFESPAEGQDPRS